MSTALTARAATAIEHTSETESLIREQFGLTNATTSEIQWFFAVSNKLRLDPFQKQIYAIMRYDGKLKREKLTIQVSIDGYRAIAADTNGYAGSDDAVFVEQDGMPVQATVTVYRIVQGVRCPFTATARYSEYVQTHSKTGQVLGQWASKPYVMLAKCAEALALRKAFPAELGGTYTDDEMSSAGGEVAEVAGLTPDQAKHLRALSESAGIPTAAAETRISNMTPSEYPKAVAALEQRIIEQASAEKTSAAPTETACAACSGSGAVDGDTCGDCGGTGVNA